MDSSIYRLLLLEGLKPILHLEETAETLFKETGRLRALRSDIESHLVALETPRVKRSGQVENWMQEVDSLNEEVAEFEESFIRRRVGICCSLASLSTNYHLATCAISMHRRVRDLTGEAGSFGSLVDQPPPEMDQPASSSISVVGAEETLSTIREYLSDDHVKILGIYGMGGIGKTTLLSKIKNEMSVTRGQFDVVIWVTVSRDVNIFNIQKTIAEQLGLEISKDVISNSKKKIFLILDDVWERLDLERIGVPLPSSENKWKIAITTRSEQVCISMGAQYMIKVPPLRHDESWELFRKKVGVEVDIDSPSIRQLAERVVEKCGGLPLALVTVGGAMVDATSAEKWEEAVQKLGNPQHNEIRGMRDVFSILKFSYDGLENDILRHCLLFCSLFPEDYNIFINHLTRLLIGGGILDGSGDDSFNSAYSQGHSVVKKLKASCLLESGTDSEILVKLHDGVRDMLLWMSSGDCDKISCDFDKFLFLSYAGLGLTKFPSLKRWRDARWISIMSNEIEEVPDEIPSCPNLLVLIMAQNSSLGKSIPDSFFTFTPILRVLDLSRTGVEELPKSIGLLVELRYLDVSWTGIMSLPEEIGNLAKLRILDLRGTSQLAVIPRESILKLSSLQVLNISDSGYTWDSSDGSYGQEIPESHANLGFLKQLESLGLTIRTSHFLEILLSSPVWSKAMEYLSLEGEDVTSALISRTCEVMKMLLHFTINNNDKLEEFILGTRQLTRLGYLELCSLPLLTRIAVRKEEDNDEVVGGSQRCHILPSLSFLVIWSCQKLEDLNFISQLSGLSVLQLFECPGIEELIVDGCEEKEEETNEYAPLLPNLNTMDLASLLNLRSISRRLLLLPSLEKLHVSGCPKLKKLPFRNDSAKKIKLIKGTQNWWDELEWEEDNIRFTFLPHFSTCQCGNCKKEIRHREAEAEAEAMEAAEPAEPADPMGGWPAEAASWEAEWTEAVDPGGWWLAEAALWEAEGTELADPTGWWPAKAALWEPETALWEAEVAEEAKEEEEEGGVQEENGGAQTDGRAPKLVGEEEDGRE